MAVGEPTEEVPVALTECWPPPRVVVLVPLVAAEDEGDAGDVDWGGGNTGALPRPPLGELTQ